MLVERREQEAGLILEIVEVGCRTVREVGRFKDETFRNVPAAPEMIEDHHVADEETIGSALKHRSDANEHSGVDDGDLVEFLAHLVNAREVFGELLHGAGGGK